MLGGGWAELDSLQSSLRNRHIYICIYILERRKRCCRNFRYKLQQHERQSVLPRASLAENDKILVFHVETIKSVAKVNAEYNYGIRQNRFPSAEDFVTFI